MLIYILVYPLNLSITKLPVTEAKVEMKAWLSLSKHLETKSHSPIYKINFIN
jgi:hypothetical protein